MSEIMRLHALLDGRVQGVGFRYFVRQRAEELGLVGWVRNLWDGQVELVAEGQRQLLEQFAEVVRRGPPGAQVDEANMDWAEASGEFNQFSISATS